MSGKGEPLEFSLAAASEAGIAAFRELELDLPEGSITCADKGYAGYHYEDLLKEIGLHLRAQRKKNSKRPMATGGIFGQTYPPVYRDGLQPTERAVFEEDPCGDAQSL